MIVAIHKQTECNLANVAGSDCDFKLLHQQHIDRRDAGWGDPWPSIRHALPGYNAMCGCSDEA